MRKIITAFNNSALKDFLALLFPNLCLACRKRQATVDKILCLSCQQRLPKTDFHLMAENEFTDRFWGRIVLEAGAALFYFTKDSAVQALIHQLKYGDKPNVGIQLGEWYGRTLKEHRPFSMIDVIVPVPLHPKRQRQRGYNQSTQFAIGLSTAMKIPYKKDALVRTIATSTQTQKTRLERFENVLQAFEVNPSSKLEGKHILLVDDVLTTGATLEACATKLLAVPNVKVSMATIAIAGVE